MGANYIADAILDCLSPSGNDVANDILQHYGTKFHSGRYPYCSGDNPYQHEKRKKLTKSDVAESDFLERVEHLRSKKDFTWTDTDGLWGKAGTVYSGDTAIAHYLGLSTTQFRPAVEIAKQEIRNQERAYAVKRREEGASLMTITKELGYSNDSSVRALLDEDVARRKSAAQNTANFLKDMVDEHGMVEVGKGIELGLGCSKQKLAESVEILRMEGYEKYERRFEQQTNPGQLTTFTLLCKPGTEYKDVYRKDLKPEDIYFPNSEYESHDDGETFDKKFVYPKSMDSKRLQIRYSDGSGGPEDGASKDGVIEIRRGVKDLDLGNAHYAQVRILVDDGYYMKGMAVYSDNMPDGVDVIYNSNKAPGTPKEKVLKPIKRNKDGTPKDDPFGSLITPGINDPDNPAFTSGGQSYYYDDNGKKQLSLINKRATEGDWREWKDKLPSQFLAKQRLPLVKKQLALTEDIQRSEYEGILEVNNPTIKKVMLTKFADSCDKAAETLQAAALPRQKYQVILPLTSIKDDEVYAPNFKDGEKVCLVRFPHGGTFEIPYLTVNNRNKEGKSVITKNAADAVGISKKVADQLSGADFDGDTVLVLPTGGSVNINHTSPLEDLKGFDTKMAYGGKAEGTFKHMTKAQTQNEMGKVSNLITDMTVLGAKEDELARAVKHSMVVIDAEKHGLDYQQSAKDNGYLELKKKYQSHVNADGRESTGAATLISRANADININKRRGSGWTNPDTGKKEYAESGEYYIKSKENKKDGTVSIINEVYNKNTKTTEFVETILKKDTNEVLYKGTPTREFTKTPHTQKATQMSQVDNAYDLMSDAAMPVEKAYADYANAMKSLANQARLEVLNTPNLQYSKEAAAKYESQVSSLNAKLNVSEKNAPLERKAQFITDTRVKEALERDPDLAEDSKELKKFKQQALTQARADVGAKRTPIHIEDDEWEAIQNGAISDTKLRAIINFVDDEELKQRATPHPSNVLSSANIARIKNLAANDYTNEQIADMFGISSSTVSKYLN